MWAWCWMVIGRPFMVLCLCSYALVVMQLGVGNYESG